ncbi:MAG: DNA polymerase IV [Burkholderiales bacterium]|nr:DNA polymerase IV [Burkholderiales bacterium]
MSAPACEAALGDMDFGGKLVDRKIIHIDMDAFYASVEERDNPTLKGKPVIVGGQPEKRGVVATANYVARKFGVHSAMPTVTALRHCPQAILITPRMDVYRSVSEEIMGILRRYAQAVEPLSLDEAYLDVSGSSLCSGSATQIARAIKADIAKTTRLTASAGVSYNKFLAKTASGMNKPDGLTVIPPTEGASFVQQLPIGKFYGIGKATEAKMRQLGVITGADLLKFSARELTFYFGSIGSWYAMLARGEDPREVVISRERKSQGCEMTFAQDVTDRDFMLKVLYEQVHATILKLEKKQLCAKSMTIKIKYDNFKQITRTKSFSEPLNLTAALEQVEILFDKADNHGKAVRLLGVTLSHIQKQSDAKQPELWRED